MTKAAQAFRAGIVALVMAWAWTPDAWAQTGEPGGDTPASLPPASGPAVPQDGVPDERPTAEVVAPAPEHKAEKTWEQRVDAFAGEYLVSPIAKVFFFDLWFWDNDDYKLDDDGQKIPVLDESGKPKLDASGQPLFERDPIQVPLTVLWLVLGAIYFTIRMGFINLRGFKHAIELTRGKYDNPSSIGEVNHFQALTSALSATVGLGNIAGVAIAVTIGGPGATFWMIVAGILGMASKFSECTLGQMYREVRPDGHIMGGAMEYLSKGLKEMKLAWLGKVLAVFFAVLCIGGSLAGGNAFQVNQSLGMIAERVTFLKDSDNHWMYGLFMSVMVGIVIIGGIKRIASTAEKIVPLMVGIYVLACLYILLANVTHIPGAFGEILSGAFAPSAAFGGFIGVLVQGFKRAAFSNEAGVGSAAIAHSAAKSEYPVQEGIVSLLEPFIDTVVVCTMTALVIVITGAYEPGYHGLGATAGAARTSYAFAGEISWFPWILSVAVLLFAYSTMISWSYYGERCWTWLFGENYTIFYRAIFLAFVFLGSVVTATNVLEFGDLMILGMALPNVLGVVLLSGKVRRALDEYWAKLQSGAVKPRH